MSPVKKEVKKSTKRRPQASGAFSDDHVFQKPESVLERENPDGNVAIMNLNDETYFYIIDGIAADFWRFIDGKSPLEKIRKKLITKHRPPECFSRDLNKVIDQLLEAGLISAR